MSGLLPNFADVTLALEDDKSPSSPLLGEEEEKKEEKKEEELNVKEDEKLNANEE